MADMDSSSSRSPLGQLYDEVSRGAGLSMREVAERSTGRGAPGLTKSRIGQLVNANPLYAISRDNITSLADGLPGVTTERVALAAMQSMGFRLPDHAITPEEAVRWDTSLSPDTKAALLSILRAARKGRGMQA